MSQFSLSRARRARLLAGDHRPLHFKGRLDPQDPLPYGCQPGAVYVLSWARESRIVCDDGTVIRTPSVPVWFITVTSVKQRPAGDWVVRFDTTDRRDPERFLRASPPVLASQSDPTVKDDESGAEESAYTSSRWGAIDDLRAVSREVQTAQTKHRAEVWAETAPARRAQREADKRRRLETSPLEGLDPEDQTVVLDLCVALREAQNMDRSRQVAAIRRRIDAIRNKARRDRAA